MCLLSFYGCFSCAHSILSEDPLFVPWSFILFFGRRIAPSTESWTLGVRTQKLLCLSAIDGLNLEIVGKLCVFKWLEVQAMMMSRCHTQFHSAYIEGLAQPSGVIGGASGKCVHTEIEILIFCDSSCQSIFPNGLAPYIYIMRVEFTLYFTPCSRQKRLIQNRSSCN
jgi:hypothetical protein